MFHTDVARSGSKLASGFESPRDPFLAAYSLLGPQISLHSLAYEICDGSSAFSGKLPQFRHLGRSQLNLRPYHSRHDSIWITMMVLGLHLEAEKFRFLCL